MRDLTRTESLLQQAFAEASEIVPARHFRYGVYISGFSASGALPEVQHDLRNGRSNQNKPSTVLSQNACEDTKCLDSFKVHCRG